MSEILLVGGSSKYFVFLLPMFQGVREKRNINLGMKPVELGTLKPMEDRGACFCGEDLRKFKFIAST